MYGMPMSMTGFARNNLTFETWYLDMEIRSVNSRFLDMHLRIPEILRPAEMHMRKLLSEKLTRGKIDLNIHLDTSSTSRSYHLDFDRLGALKTTLNDLKKAFPQSIAPSLMEILNSPGVIINQTPDPNKLQNICLDCVKNTVDKLISQRHSEGERLALTILEKNNQIRGLCDLLKEQLPVLIEIANQRLTDKLTHLNAEPDPKRLEEELVYLANKSDVTEELDRLYTHLSAVEDTLASNQPCGRKLDFLMQELNRETNTLSSKINSSCTTNTVIALKVLIEQIREQVQNIE